MIIDPIFMYGSNLCPNQLSKRALSWDFTYTLAYLPNHELRFNRGLACGLPQDYLRAIEREGLPRTQACRAGCGCQGQADNI